MTSKKKKIENLETRPPIVVVLGHVDHGKTTLLDYIRKTNIAEKESGGITQHIGAYQIKYNNKFITFIDTPGHEAFSQMRSRGTKVADIAILVVAAEEGVKPQTKEVISHIKKFKIPVVVAINKIDKPTANPKKVIGELAKEGIVVESQGGKIPSINISAKTGQGIDELLEVLLLVAEIEELKVDYKKPASGVVVESYLDSQRGATATLLIHEGILKKGDIILCGNSYGKIRILENFQGDSISEASPSMPAVAIGLNQVPTIGEKFEVWKSEEEAKKKAEAAIKEKLALARENASILNGKQSNSLKSEDSDGEEKNEIKTLDIILKADVQGSLEAIQKTIENIKQENIGINILQEGVGNISESDIKLAYSTNSIIIGFRVKCANFIFNLAKRQGVKIRIFEVIYELVEEIKKNLSKLLEPEIIREDLGRLKVIAIFKKEKSRMIIGGKVISGKVINKVKVDVIRPASSTGGDKEKIATGRISQLQHNKKDVPEIEKGKEAGILFEGEPVIEEGDILEIYKEEKKQKEL